MVSIRLRRGHLEAHQVDRVIIGRREHVKSDRRLVSYGNNMDIHSGMIFATLAVGNAIDKRVVDTVRVRVWPGIVLVWSVEQALSIGRDCNRAMCTRLLMYLRDLE